MTANRWGTPTWKFFHTLVSKIKDDSFKYALPQLFVLLIRICTYLPCPECAHHASTYLKNIPMHTIVNKQALIDIFFNMHNTVNKRLGKPPFDHRNLGYYNSLSVVQTYNDFIKEYHTRGNMTQITETFHRKFVQRDLRQWIMQNIQHFE